jgi:hypothetical protein
VSAAVRRSEISVASYRSNPPQQGGERRGLEGFLERGVGAQLARGGGEIPTPDLSGAP